jgi:hypothetical protein
MSVCYVFIILAPAGFHMDKTLIVFKRCFMLLSAVQHSSSSKMTPPLAVSISSPSRLLFFDYLGHGAERNHKLKGRFKASSTELPTPTY